MWPFPKKGTARINSVVGQFDNMIEDLLQGIAENFQRKYRNITVIDELGKENTLIDAANVAASTLIVKLRALMEG
jgi:dihydroneopterin aldolase